MVLTGYDARSGSSRAPPVARQAPWAGASERQVLVVLRGSAQASPKKNGEKMASGFISEELEKNMRYFDETKTKTTTKNKRQILIRRAAAFIAQLYIASTN